MNAFTIVLLIGAVWAVGFTIYGVVRPRMGHRIDPNAALGRADGATTALIQPATRTKDEGGRRS